MKKIILLDLDGTLVNTAHESFKSQKDGLIETDITRIPLFDGVLVFIDKLKELGYLPIIISDSHPRYVNPIAENIFSLPALSLADKPNSIKTKEFLIKSLDISSFSKQCIVIGDTWLDIELGRSLNCPTILTKFYTASANELRDGIGDDWRQLKSGPTYVTNSFNRILELIADPTKYLLSCEAVFLDVKSKQSRKFKSEIFNDHFTAFRSLGRQNSGESDVYGIADKYYEFQREGRSIETVKKLAQGVDNYLEFVLESTTDLNWDLLTYVSDKSTTIPADKMSLLFDNLQSPLKKEKIFFWKSDIQGSIRNQKHFKERRGFVNENMYIDENLILKDKNIVVIDDQFTTGGTAFAITDLLRKQGVKNVLIVTLFYLITNVESEKNCPRCQKRMVVKIRRSDGNKFLSCTPSQYGGIGCGFAMNIIE
jgi:phosphoglycolate phosphatase-like HAD superfamily hydrolase